MDLDNVFARYHAINTCSKKDVQVDPRHDCELDIGEIDSVKRAVFCLLGLASSSRS